MLEHNHVVPNAHNTAVQNSVFATELTDSDITITPAAAERLRVLQQSSDPAFSGIRLFVTGGGCSGMTYSMTYAECLTPFDSVLHDDGYQLVVDAVTLNYLQGCNIDFARQGLNESFVFKNVFQSVGGSGSCSGCASSGRGTY